MRTFCSSSVFINPGFTSEVNSPEESYLQHLGSANFGNTENTFTNVTTVTKNVNFVEEDPPQTKSHLKTGDAPSSAGENSDTESAKDGTSVTSDHETNCEFNKKSTSVIVNGVTGGDIVSLPLAETHQNPKSSHTKKTSFGVRNRLFRY